MTLKGRNIYSLLFFLYIIHLLRCICSKKSSENSSVVNSQNVSVSEEIDEKVLSGNSIYLNINGNSDFETESVKSEALLHDANNGHIVASTPLNTTYQDIGAEFVFGPIDFSMYGISVMEIAIMTMHSDKSFSGHIVHTPHEVSYYDRVR